MLSWAFRSVVAAWLVLITAGGAYADEIVIKSASIEASDKSWALNTKVDLQLTPALEQLVNKGVTLHFVTEVTVYKKRWYWLDEKIVDQVRVSKISYQALTNQYRVTLGSFNLVAANLKQAIAAVSTIEDWLIADQNQLQNNQNYQVSLRMRLDTNQLAKPFQINAINSKSWNLQSDWYRFEFVPKMSAQEPNPS